MLNHRKRVDLDCSIEQITVVRLIAVPRQLVFVEAKELVLKENLNLVEEKVFSSLPPILEVDVIMIEAEEEVQPPEDEEVELTLLKVLEFVDHHHLPETQKILVEVEV